MIRNRVYEEKISGGHTFGMQVPNDVLSKLHREKDRFDAAFQSGIRGDLVDHALNFIHTAWHFTDWLWVKKEIRVRRAFKVEKLRDFQEKVSERYHCLSVCDVIANASKHGGWASMYIIRPLDPKVTPPLDKIPGWPKIDTSNKDLYEWKERSRPDVDTFLVPYHIHSKGVGEPIEDHKWEIRLVVNEERAIRGEVFIEKVFREVCELDRHVDDYGFVPHSREALAEAANGATGDD